MEVALPFQQIPEDLNEPAGLGQQLEHMQEGHYSRRLYAFILHEMQHLINSISADPAFLPIRDELIARVPTADFVKNTLEQLATLHFERLDFNTKLADLHLMLDEAQGKMEKLQNDTSGDRCWVFRFIFSFRRIDRKIKRAKELIKILEHCRVKGTSELSKFEEKLINQFLEKFRHILLDILFERGGDLDHVDGVLRRCVLRFNAVPVAIRISNSAGLRIEHDNFFGKINNISTSFKNWLDEEEPRMKKDMYVSGIMYGGITLLLCTIMISRKRI